MKPRVAVIWRVYTPIFWFCLCKNGFRMHSHKFITIELEKISLAEFRGKLSRMCSFLCCLGN